MKIPPLPPFYKGGGFSAVLRGCWLDFLFLRGELKAILPSYWLTSLFQTEEQQYAASASPFEKRKQQKHCGTLKKNSDQASPFVKGGLREIFYCAILLPLNEEMLA
jgi:hypothetical protein